MSELTNDADLSAQLKRISEHLGFLEKKLDTLIEQSQKRKPLNGGEYGNRGYSQGPYRQGNRPSYGQKSYSQKSYGPHGTRTAHYDKKFTPHRGAHH